VGLGRPFDSNQHFNVDKSTIATSDLINRLATPLLRIWK